ncbi:histidine phosphatase family protein [Patescibacteria group bacterium]
MGKKLKNRYLILRHGETSQQAKRSAYTYKWPDNPPTRLTKRGEKQIREAAKRLEKEGINFMFSSDLFRTRQTSKIVSERLGIKPKFDKRLRDINLGVFSGKLKKDFYKAFPDVKKRFVQRPKNGESWNDVKKRVFEVIKEIEKKHKDKKILIVSHGDPLWLLEGIAKGSIEKELLSVKKLKKDYINVGELRNLYGFSQK